MMGVAYLLSENRKAVNFRTVVIASYALCGFANFGSAAIWIGGIGTIVPSKRGELANLALSNVFLAATLAAFMTASVAGFFYTGDSVLFGK